jgi:dGTPase
MSADAEYATKLSELVRRSLVVGAGDLRDVCIMCQGADPTAVARELKARGITDEKFARGRRDARLGAARARRLAGDLLALLPGANPDDSQWWFSLDCIERIADRVYLATGASRLVNIGTSTLATYYQNRFAATCTTLDIDEDLISAVNSVARAPVGQVYDVASAPPSITPQPEVAVIDPPWYEQQTRLFLLRASQLLPAGSYVFSTLPRELTRPAAVSERERLATYARDAGLQVDEVFGGLVEYTMPDFEKAAFRSFEKIQGRPWRYADLVSMRKEREPKAPHDLAPSPRPTRYFRGHSRKLRIFLHPSRTDPSVAEPLVAVPAYSSTVSATGVDRSKIALWTSTNAGFRVRDYSIAEIALSAWQNTTSKDAALSAVKGHDAASLFLQTLYDFLKLPDDAGPIRRTPRIIADHRRAALSAWAEQEPPDPDGDGYRNRFARDRDRVLWSNGIRQLANKTQIFSTGESDFVRQRLTHSTEVMQLATTVGSSLGLDRDLIEAGALAHDIGHTPFGHAGEVALDKSLKAISASLGFNHYEHGLDVVVWLEDAYRHPSNGGKFGLDLSRPVLECIFKHTFCYGEGPSNQKALFEASKHKSVLIDGPCHLEGQAVRAADKISYLISDIEDGLRLGAITIDDLRTCALFSHPPIDLVHEVGESPLATFVAQRRSIIGVLMEDLIDETARRLAAYKTRADVVEHAAYTVDHSETIRQELSEVWHRVQAGKLHHDARVVATNRRAAHMVNRLLMVFALRPDLIAPDFRAVYQDLRETEYMAWYQRATSRDGVRVPLEATKELALEFMIGHDPRRHMTVEDVVQAKDYVASMTDQYAIRRYRELFL